MPIAVDLSELPAEVLSKMHKVCTDEFAAQCVMAKLRQRAVAKFYADNRPKAIDGIGGMEMAVDPWMISYLNMKHGRQVMKDPEFRKWLLKEDESFRVRSGGTKVQVGWAPLSKHAVFHKSYGDS